VFCFVVFLSDFNETGISRRDFRKILKHQIILKYVQWEPCYFMRTDGETVGVTDRHDEANIHFSQFLRTRLESLKVSKQTDNNFA
jgi:hypothetical protein